MPSRERVAKPAPQKSTAAELEQLAEDDAAVAAAQDSAQVDLSDLDDLLDEIDTLLEEQDVLVNFRQRGGQ